MLTSMTSSFSARRGESTCSTSTRCLCAWDEGHPYIPEAIYWKFIPDYATIASSLFDLTRKSQLNQLQWSAACEEAFRRLKKALCSPPILRTPDFEQGFVVQTDASKRVVGAVLSQTADDGTDQPVAYYSQKLLAWEENYSTVEKAVLHFLHPFILGTHSISSLRYCVSCMYPCIIAYKLS